MQNKDVNLRPLLFMVADENQGARRIMTDILLALGVSDVHGEGGHKECQKALSVTPIDVLILDYQLGGGRGPELVREIRSDKDHLCRYIPILLTCSHTRLVDIQSARDCGANMVISKPYSVTSLYDRLSWIAYRPRPFVSSGGYCGPDRRFKDKPIVSQDRRGSGEDAKAQANPSTQQAVAV